MVHGAAVGDAEAALAAAVAVAAANATAAAALVVNEGGRATAAGVL